jgi:hypothetical protein
MPVIADRVSRRDSDRHPFPANHAALRKDAQALQVVRGGLGHTHTKGEFMHDYCHLMTFGDNAQMNVRCFDGVQDMAGRGCLSDSSISYGFVLFILYIVNVV